VKVILFGASGMVGGGVLRECLRDPTVEQVLAVGRRALGVDDPKLREIHLSDLSNLTGVEGQLGGFDAAFWCLGVSSVGMSEDEYRRVTYDLTLTVARKLAPLNPGLTFTYVSGAGTDSTEHGRAMWARVKGRTENELLKLPFKAAYMFRPGFIRTRRGDRIPSGTYRVLYSVILPFVLLASVAAPNVLTSTDRVGRAMIHVVTRGAPRRWLSNREINDLAR
jgi:uncharacterized protein YbjT (DUF2867 family)